MKRVDPIPIDELMAVFTKRLGIDGDLARMKIYQAWDDAVGLKVAHSTAKKYYREGDKVLFCTMTSSPLANQLRFQADIIKKRINEDLGKEYISKVVIR